MLFVINADGKILKVNPAVERRLGYSEAELADQRVLVVHPPERWDEADAIIAKMLAGQAVVCTVPLLAKDGVHVPVETRVVRCRWHNQNMLLGISRDVSERLHVEEALRCREEQLGAIIEHSPSAIILFDPDGCIRLWNRAAERMYGWRADEVLGRTLPTVPAEKHPERLNFQARVNQGEVISYTEVERRRKDGSTIHVGLSVAPLRNAAGAVYAQMSITTDITERVQLTQALRASEEQNRKLLETVPAPVIIYALDDTDYTILYVNRAAQALWQARSEAGNLIGLPALQVIRSDEHLLVDPVIDELRAGEPQDCIEARLLGPDGQAIDIVASSTATLYQGRAAAMLLINDITQLKHTQAELVRHGQMLAALGERQLLARELHDGLGQSLAYLSVQAQTAQMLLAEGKTLAVQSGLQQMTQVAHEAQDNIRKHILGLRTHDDTSGDMFEALEATLHQLSLECGVQATLSVPEDAPRPTFAPAVEEQVLCIIQEALVNIRKHAFAHKAEVWFSFTGEEARVMISDDGVGFDPTLIPAGEQGAHFGLRIMAERTAQIGGLLELRAVPGQGCRVVLTIPRLFSGSAAPTPEDLVTIQNLRVLLVDDHPLYLEGIRHLLVSRGLTVVGVAHDGLEALEQARALQPDVVVMDVEMARCNGLEATQAIKAEMPHIKVVMLTVSEDADNLFAALRNGASGYLLKSLDGNDFCRQLAGVVRGEAPLPPALAAHVLSEFAQRRVTPPVRISDRPLSPRQQEILKQVAQGLPYKEIAAAQNLSVQSIKYHMAQILDRLNMTTREQAIAYARRVLSA
jgi:PAS domain S-box-containing protein